MATQMNEANYHAMIEALYTFGARAAQASEEMSAAATACLNKLGDEDASVAAICEAVEKTRKRYNDLALKALQIAGAMAKELGQGELERMIWEYANDDF